MALLSRYADQQNTTSSCIVGRVQRAEWQPQRSTFTHTQLADMMQSASLLWSALFARGSTLLMQKSKPHHLTLKTKRSSDDLLLIQHIHTIIIIIIVTLQKITACHFVPDLHCFFSPCSRRFYNFDITIDQMMHMLSHKTNEQDVGRALWVVQSRHLSYAQHTSNLVATP